MEMQKNTPLGWRPLWSPLEGFPFPNSPGLDIKTVNSDSQMGAEVATYKAYHAKEFQPEVPNSINLQSMEELNLGLLTCMTGFYLESP